MSMGAVQFRGLHCCFPVHTVQHCSANKPETSNIPFGHTCSSAGSLPPLSRDIAALEIVNVSHGQFGSLAVVPKLLIGGTAFHSLTLTRDYCVLLHAECLLSSWLMQSTFLNNTAGQMGGALQLQTPQQVLVHSVGDLCIKGWLRFNACP